MVFQLAERQTPIKLGNSAHHFFQTQTLYIWRVRPVRLRHWPPAIQQKLTFNEQIQVDIVIKHFLCVRKNTCLGEDSHQYIQQPWSYQKSPQWSEFKHQHNWIVAHMNITELYADMNITEL